MNNCAYFNQSYCLISPAALAAVIPLVDINIREAIPPDRQGHGKSQGHRLCKKYKGLGHRRNDHTQPKPRPTPQARAVNDPGWHRDDAVQEPAEVRFIPRPQQALDTTNGRGPGEKINEEGATWLRLLLLRWRGRGRARTGVSKIEWAQHQSKIN